MDIDNPLLRKATISEDRDQTRVSTFSANPQPSSPRKVPAAIRNLVARLGLRYRPSGQADLEAHAGTIALLCEDLADMPPDLLDRAIRMHALKSHFMPKASELIALAKSLTEPKKGIKIDQALADKYNATMSDEGRAKGLRWSIANGELVLGPA